MESDRTTQKCIPPTILGTLLGSVHFSLLKKRCSGSWVRFQITIRKNFSELKSGMFILLYWESWIGWHLCPNNGIPFRNSWDIERDFMFGSICWGKWCLCLCSSSKGTFSWSTNVYTSNMSLTFRRLQIIAILQAMEISAQNTIIIQTSSPSVVFCLTLQWELLCL